MGGKKTVEKSREWEKERRDKLNTGFHDLYKLLPDHDPSISLSKMDILRKAAEYIRLLQDQNEEIIKSGDNDVLKNEAERLKKRVAHLLLKTKDLVVALKAAGVPIPNNNKKKKKSKAHKATNGKDQNHVPLSSGANARPKVPSAVTVGNNDKATGNIADPPLQGKRVKCGCEKAAKKNPLSELNCTSAATTSVPPNQLTVVPGSQPSATILSAPLQANIQTLAPTLGPGTLIFRDGRVVTVPPAAPVVPQILVKPQPTFIVMQRAPIVPLKRDKVPLIAPKRRDITQTTFSNKAPIPAIKTFRLESYPRSYKPKGKKKKEEYSADTTQSSKNETPAAQQVASSSTAKTSSESAVLLKSPPAKKLKRKAEPVSCKTKSSKSTSSHGQQPEVAQATEDVKKSSDDHIEQTPTKGSEKGAPSVNDESEGVVASENLMKDSAPTSMPEEGTDDCGPFAEVSTGQATITVHQIVTQTEASNNTIEVDCDVGKVNVETLTHPNILDKDTEEMNTNVSNDAPCGKVLKQTSDVCLAASTLATGPSHSDSDVGTDKSFKELHFTANKATEKSDVVEERIEDSRATVSTLIVMERPPLPENQTDIIPDKETASLQRLTSEDSAKFPLSDAMQDKGTAGRGLCPMEGEIELHKPPSPKNSVSSLLANAAPQSCSASMLSERPLVSTANPSGSFPSHIPLTTVAIPVSYPSHSGIQGATLFNGPRTPSRLTNPPVSSVSGVSAPCTISPCRSSMPGSSLSSNSEITPVSSASFSSRTAVTSTGSQLNSTSTSNTNLVSHNYTSSFTIDAPLGVNQVLPRSQVGSTFAGPQKVRTFEESHNRTTTLQSKPDIKSSTTSTNHISAPKDMPRRNVDMDADLCPSINTVTQPVSYQNSHFSVQRRTLKDVHYSKPHTSLGSVPLHVGSSQKRCYPDNLDRSNTSGQLALQTARSTETNISTLPNSSIPSSLPSNAQVYPFGMPVVPTEPSRPESFFNYENPIATLPSDPFFSNYKPAELTVSCATNAGFSYSTFTTQAPTVRSVARQLFPSDPLSSISNGYNLDTNLPPLSSSAGQMFQFSSYSNTNSFRDPLLFSNDFLSTPTKNASLDSTNEKDNGANKTNFPDILHSATTMNPLPNIPCSFSVGQMPPSSSSYVSSDSRTGDHRKLYQADQAVFNPKHIPKPGGDGNFSMNVITSSSELKIQDTRNPSNTDYNKLAEVPQNFNFPYVNAQSLAPQMLDSFNFNVRDSVQHSQNIPPRSLTLQNHSNSSNVDKHFQKPSTHGMNSQKPSHPKEFPANTTVASSTARSQYDVQPNAFHNEANYPDPAKSSQGTNSFRVCGGNSQSNQGVQTHQSYLCNPKQVMNKPLVPPAGNQKFSCSSQANQILTTNYDKKYPKTVQDSLYADNHMKIAGCQTESADCSLTVRPQKNYQPVTSLVHSLKTSSHSMNSSTNVFSHSNTNQPMQQILASYPGPSSKPVPQSIYSHPTTAAGNQYSHVGDSRNTQNLFRLSHISSSQSNPPPYQPCSSSSQFSTIETLAQQTIIAPHRKPPNNAGNQMVGHLDTSDVNVFGEMGVPQNQTIEKDPQSDIMSNFSMSNITGYSSQSVMNGTNRSQNQNQPYSQLRNTEQNTNKAQYPQSGSLNAAPAKHCDYPLSSILTGLNDPVLNTADQSAPPGRRFLVTNENQQTNKPAANAATEKSCNDKTIDKQYSTNTEGSTFKTTENNPCNPDYLRSKETERNFIPIIEDVRLNSEFSNDLFSSLQVPTGGTHADSISPTAAFLLAFPLVSTSKNSENPHESDPQDNNTSTPTTILQIGNIEPTNSDMFHPLEFGKEMETPDYLGPLADKCKRKENVSTKPKKPNYNSYNYPTMSGDYNIHYDQTWSDQSKNKSGETRKKTDKQSKFCGNGNYELCKDKKKKNKISVNWMAAPDVETFQKDQEGSSFQANLSFPMDIDALPDLCANKKTNTYSWSPSKSLLPLDSGLVIPSTLPTLVGDLALGTPTPADTYKRCDTAKKQDKSPEKQTSLKSQTNFLSVSQLVDPKSKKKLPDKSKKPEKKKSTSFQKRKDLSTVPNEPCMYPDSFLPPLGWDKYRYRNNYTAEALIASQDVNESANFTYHQNPNYFMGSDLNQEHHQNQQYQNSFNFSQNQFQTFSAEEYQNPSFSINSTQSSSSKRGGSIDKRCRDDTARFPGGASSYQSHPPSLQPYSSAPPLSSAPPSNFTSNSTTSVTNFNLSTIFPEINERTGSQGPTGPSQQQQQQQHQQQQHNAQPHPHNNMTSFQNSNPSNNYRTHNL